MEQHAAKRRRAGRQASGMAVAADTAATEGDVPLLVCVLAGNPATSAGVLACLNSADARHLRQLHPAVAGVVVTVPWCDTDTEVMGVVRWRACLPAAVGMRLAPLAAYDSLPIKPLGGITHLDLHNCEGVTDELLSLLPTSLRVLNVCDCEELTSRASFAHLTALVSLDCSGTWVVSTRTDGLPSSLQELGISRMEEFQDGASLAHLRELRVLRANLSALDDVTLASLPPSLEELHAADSWGLTPAVSFGHLTALRMLDVGNSGIGDALLATMPPCLVNLNVQKCDNLTPAATLPRLPVLQLLDVSGTGIGDALVTSLPASLIELRLAGCRRVSAGATLDHLRALRVLHCIGTKLAPASLAACRARGCVVPAASALRGHKVFVAALALLGDGRLASGDSSGVVRLWDMATGGEATAEFRMNIPVHVLAALRNGHRLAVGTASFYDKNAGFIEVWDVGAVSPTRCAAINCRRGVQAFALLHDGRLVAGYRDGKVNIVDVDASAVVTTLSGHTEWVTALAVLPDGALASGSQDKSVRVWDVRARVCVATLTGHTGEVTCLAVLPDGRLASGSSDGNVRLWDVGARACVGMLSGHTGEVTALAALPDGRLVSGSEDGTIRLWDTRPAAAAGVSRAAGAVPGVGVGVLGGSVGALLSLPDGRLACGGSSGTQGSGHGEGLVYLLEVPPPAACE